MASSPNDYNYTIRQAADYVGVHDKTIRRYLQRGILEAIQIKGINGLEYRISEASLKQLATLLDRTVIQSEDEFGSTLSIDPNEQLLNRILFEVETVQSTQRLMIGHLSELEELHQAVAQLREEVNALGKEQAQWKDSWSELKEGFEELRNLLPSPRGDLSSSEIRELGEKVDRLTDAFRASGEPPPKRPWWRFGERSKPGR